ncbi:MAG: alpha/beta hydrolase [Bacilli bacterium]
MIKKQEFILNSECDNLPLGVTIMIPDKKIKGIVQIAHGMAEHRKRYYHFMTYLAKNGYITVINDHRGHGESIRDSADLGYFYDETGEYITEDLHQITKYIKDRFRDYPVTLFGHSMGSLIVRNYLKKYDNEIDNLIVSGSPSENKGIKLGLCLVKKLISKRGVKERNSFIDNLTFGPYRKKFKSDGDNGWLSRDVNEVEKYNIDPLCGFSFTLNGFLNLFLLLLNTYDKTGYKVLNSNLRILFIAGENDPVIVSQPDFNKAVLFLKNLGYSNIASILYPLMRHEVLNETGKEKVYKDIMEFIECV